MKKSTSLSTLAISAASFAAVLAAPPPPPTLTIDWFTVDGGGGASAFGYDYLEGTIGQWDADPTDAPKLGAGQRALFSGFWVDGEDTDCPVIQGEPESEVACPGGSTFFTVFVAGTPPLTYSWRKGGVPIDTLSNPSAATFKLELNGLTVSDEGSYDCVISNTCGSVTSQVVTLRVGLADVGKQGGLPGRDGLYDNNDFVVFIGFFFANDPIADVGRQGGLPGGDGLWDNNDFTVFVDYFFNRC